MIAIFDLDETLTRFDTNLPYLIGWAFSRPRLWVRMPGLSVDLLRYKSGKISNTQLKTRFYTRLMAGANPADESQWTERFNRFVVKHWMLDDALKTVQNYHQQGHRVVLATASVDIYVTGLAQLLGFTEVVCSVMQRDANGALTGAMAGDNCYGEGKLAAMQRHLGAGFDTATVVCYSDSVSDLPLLARADRAVLINPGRKLKPWVIRHGFESVVWR